MRVNSWAFCQSSFNADSDSFWLNKFVYKQKGSFNDYCVRCLVNSLNVCRFPRTSTLDCASVWGSVKAQLVCNTRQQKPFTIQKLYMWFSIQLEINFFAVSELVQIFLFDFLLCFAVCSIFITLTWGPHNFTSNISGQFGFDEC